jgi:UDP-glucose 4-epimerase
MKRALVTGAAGFIGSHVADQCLRRGMDVTAVDDLSGGFVENVPVGVRFVRADLRDPAAVAALWHGTRYHYVYHLAAYAAEGLSHFIRRYNYQTNLIASINLINHAVHHDVECFVFTSSIAVYGANQTPMTEDLVPRPEDPYGISKYAVELDLAAAHEMFGLPYTVFRPHNVYGEKQNLADRYRNVIGIFMNQVMSGQPMTIFGDGQQTRAFTHVDDIAPVIAGAPLEPRAYQQVFNVGADTPYSVLELAHEVARAFEVEANIQHLPPRNEVVHAFASHAKAREVFSQEAKIPLDEGLRRMLRWARERGPTPPVVFDSIEVTRNLPSSWKLGVA